MSSCAHENLGKAVAIAVVSLLLLPVMVFCGCREHHVEPIAKPSDSTDDSGGLPEDYVRLASQIAEQTWQSKQLPASTDAAQDRAMLQNMIVELRAISSDNPDVEFIRDETLESTITALDIWDSWQQLPDPPGFGEQFMSAFSHTLIGNEQHVAESMQKIESRNEFIRASAKRMIAAEHRATAARLMLPRIAAKWAGPQVVPNGQVSVDVDESWPQGDSAWLTLTNSTEATLHNCTIVVDLEGRGSAKRHVHFVAQWRPGQPLFCRYDRGVLVEVLGERAMEGLPPRIEAVSVALYAGEMSCQTAPYKYTTSERDRDIQRYCNDLAVFCRFQAFKSGLFESEMPALMFRFEGVAFLPAGTLTATLPDGTTNKVAFRRWDQGEELEVRFRDLDKLPARTGMELTIDGSEAELQLDLVRLSD